MEKVYSQSLIYHVERLVNPTSYNTLIKNSAELVDDTIDLSKKPSGMSDSDYIEQQTPHALFNFLAIEITKKTKIKKIVASLVNNFSVVGKSIIPITKLSFYSLQNRNLDFFKNIDEPTLNLCKLSIDGTEYNSYTDFATTGKNTFKVSERDRIPTNVVKFRSDNFKTYPFLPRTVKSKKSIIDPLSNFFNVSFSENLETNPNLDIQSQTKYLLIFPSASVPIPRSIVHTNSGNISVEILINLVLEDI